MAAKLTKRLPRVVRGHSWGEAMGWVRIARKAAERSAYAEGWRDAQEAQRQAELAVLEQMADDLLNRQA